MKTVHHFNTARDKLLHIETEGAIVNIMVGLTEHGTDRAVTAIEILPDTNGDGCGNPAWYVADDPTAKAQNIRIVQKEK